MVKKDVIKHLALALIMLFAGINVSYSQTNNEVTLVVSGDGSTKEEATKSALRSAIEQTYGTFVSSNTKILNDELVKDEIVTISSGNIKNFKSISENQTNGRWYVTVQATVSIGKLIEYTKSKGSEAEFAGATFAMNVKMKQFYIRNQETALKNLGKQLRALFLTSFDYEINANEPRPGNGGVYYVPIIVTVKANKNAEACYQLYHKTLSSLSTYSRGQEDAKGIINGTNKYYLSINQYPALEGIESVMKECICNFTLSDGSHNYVGHYNYNNNNPKVELLYSGTNKVFTTARYINKRRGPLSIERMPNPYGGNPFLPILANSNYAGNIIATFTFELRYILDELSKVSNFKITPNGLNK